MTSISEAREFAELHFGPGVQTMLVDQGPYGRGWYAWIPSRDPSTEFLVGPIHLDTLIATMTGQAEQVSRWKPVQIIRDDAESVEG